MKLLIVSDLHAFQKPRKTIPSLVNFSDADRGPKNDPLLGLRVMCESKSFGVPDLMLCAGDLADSADPLALKSAWKELHEIQNSLGISDFVATCGNHDLDTRYQENRFDPKGYLRKLEPSFPLPGYEKNSLQQLKYWSNNFSIVEGVNWRVLTINSCAYHGYGEEAEPELRQGRISDHTIEEIASELQSLQDGLRKKFNICLVHHHLREMHTDVYEDTSRMKGSGNLLALLSKSEFGEWFVIHGHVHRSGMYCEGGNSGPIVLSCASFSVSLARAPQNPSTNQFYIVNFDDPIDGRHRIRGRVQAWDWAASYGWQKATNRKGSIGPEDGFGFRGDIPPFAANIAKQVHASGKLDWNSILSSFPDLKNFLPIDRENLIQELEAGGDIKVSREGETIREVVIK